jgi:hypothetical protein
MVWMSGQSWRIHAQRQEMLNMDFACDLAAALMKIDEHEQALRLVLNAIDVQQRSENFCTCPRCSE